MKKITALLLSLLLVLSLLPTFIYADTGNESGMQELVEVVWNGTTSGQVCDATVTLYKYQSAEPIDAEYQSMWGTFRLVITDANGNVLIDEDFDTASKSISLTEPGDYYACVYAAKGDLQGLSHADGSYEPLTQHFCVIGIYEPTVYDELNFLFEMCCDDYSEDHDRAFREYLAIIHGIAASDEDFSLTEGADYMLNTMSDYSELKYAALYEEFCANEGYATMERTSLCGYDPEILTEEETYGFWSGECWRYFADGLDFVVFGDNEQLLPYAEYISDMSDDTFSDDTISGDTISDNSPSNHNNNNQPLPLIIAGVVVVVVLIVGAAVILPRQKKRRKKKRKNA